MIIWGGVARCCPIDSVIHDPAAAAYDPAADTWRPLRDVPSPWSGDDGVAIVEATDGDLVVWRDGRLGRFDVAEDIWHDLGPSPSRPWNCSTSAGHPNRGGLLGSTLFVWTGGCKLEYGSALQLGDDEWTDLGGVPEQLGPVVAARDRFIGVTRAGGPAGVSVIEFDPAARAWSQPVPAPDTVGDSPALVWTGTELLAWGGHDGGYIRTGAAYQPSSGAIQHQQDGSVAVAPERDCEDEPDVEVLLNDVIPADALTSLAGVRLLPDGCVEIGFGGPSALKRARSDPRLATLLDHPAVVLVERRFTTAELDAAIERTAKVLNEMLAATPDDTRDGWPWSGHVETVDNIVVVRIDRAAYEEHRDQIESRLRDDVNRGILVIDASRPHRQETTDL
jgi:hypothetical protein